MQKNNYINQIDGLRALAILLVVIFHFFPSLLVGGFIGVDVFFVISGFVISRLILSELEKGQFKLVGFYKKRIIRIFPALFLVLAFCLCVGWLTLFQDELYQLAKHTLAGALFYSNFTLLDEVNYFDGAANSKVLLNLWSLAIEEQFYIIWPIVLIFLYKIGRYWLVFFTVVFACISFYQNLHTVNIFAEKAFYLPWCRFWQLLVGALIAIHESKIKQLVTPHPYYSYNVLGWFGLALLLVSATIITPENAYPGFWALLPTFSTACILFQLLIQPDRLKLLNHSVMLGLGRISYPLYLWHWPLLSLMHIFNLKTLGWQLFTLSCSFLFSYLTYTYIEYPIRFVYKTSKRVVYLIMAMVILAIISIIILLSNGATKREANKNYLTYSQAQHETRMLSCNKMLGFVNSLCAKKNLNVKADVVLLGDSHAAALYVGFAKNLEYHNLNLLHLGRIGCPYLPWVDWTKKSEPSCAKSSDIKNAYSYILKNPDIKHVVLAMRWKNYANDTSGRFSSTQKLNLEGDKLLIDTLNKTVNMLKKAGKKIYIVQTVPDVDVKKCIGRVWEANTHNCEIDLKKYHDDNFKAEQAIQQVYSNNPSFLYYSTLSQMCREEMDCNIVRENKFLYKDSNHVSEFGAEVITKALAEQILKTESVLK